MAGPQYTTLPQANRNWWEDPMRQTGNLLTQLVIAKMAHNMRMDEKKAEIEEKKAMLQQQERSEARKAGYTPVSRTEYHEDTNNPDIPSDIQVIGGVPMRPFQPRVATIDGVRLIQTAPGKFEPYKDPKIESGKYKPGEVVKFTVGNEEVSGMYTAEPQDAIVRPTGAIPGFKEVASAPRYKPGETNVKIDMPPGEDAATKKYGEEVGQSAAKRNQIATEAQRLNADFAVVEDALAKGAVTGRGQETIMEIKKAAELLGIPAGEGVGQQEMIRSITNKMALRMRNPESGLGLTGNTSNQDLAFLKNSTVGLEKTVIGNKMIMDANKRLNKMAIDVADEQQRLIEANGGRIPLNLEANIRKYVNNYKMFSNEEIKDMKRLTGTIKATGFDKKTGRKTIQLEDGSWEYANAD